MDLDKLERFISNSFCNVGQSFYDHYVEANVNFRSKLGMKEVIIRRQLGHCCDWCADLAGIYDAYNAPDNIYRRHRNCRCLVTYKSEKGYQDAWNKKIYQTQREARIERIKTISRQRAYINQYSDDVDTNKRIVETNILFQDKKVIKDLKKVFKGYVPAKLVNGTESGCNMEFIPIAKDVYKIVRVIVNVASPAGTTHVDLNNPALANSYHERGHDLINCLALKRAGISYEGMVSIAQRRAIEEEYIKIRKELFVAAFPDDVFPNISTEKIYEIIGEVISARAMTPDELFAETLVQMHANSHSYVAERIYNYIIEEWNK